eukprot:GHVS01028653.1.p2 GENE.GHVS01028653.1~~GHVS01028653.1.p2  ORF type:complete len:122 (+),score=15.78 GHVS01028653.1:1139-1504(+)
MFEAEFNVFMLLDFSLQLKLEHVLPHIRQYLEAKDVSFDEMYGTSEEAFVAWSAGLIACIEEGVQQTDVVGDNVLLGHGESKRRYLHATTKQRLGMPAGRIGCARDSSAKTPEKDRPSVEL